MSCVSCFFLSFGNSESAMIALLCLFGGVSIASWNALDVLTVELYPSDKRWAPQTEVLGARSEVLGAGWEVSIARGEVLGAGWEDLGAGCRVRRFLGVKWEGLGAGGNILGARSEDLGATWEESRSGSFECCVPDLKYQLLGAGLGVLGARCGLPGARHLFLGAACQPWAAGYSFWGAGCAFKAFEFPFWGAGCPFQASRCQFRGATCPLQVPPEAGYPPLPSGIPPPTAALPVLPRTTAFGFLNALCKLAAVLGISIFTSFVGITKAVPILFASAALALGSSLALKLPETRGQVLQ